MRRSILPVLLVLSAGQSLAAPASSVPDALPGLVSGVRGSGDQLSLELKPTDGASRTLRVGDIFQDGWALTALTNTTATLTRDSVSRTVGLNPSGALATAAPTGAPSTVRVAGLNIPPEVQAILDLSDDDVLARVRAQGRTPLLGPLPGLTAEESRRLQLYYLRSSLFYPAVRTVAQARVDAARAAGIDARLTINPDDVSSALFPDYKALENRTRTASNQQAMADYAAAQGTAPSIWEWPNGQPLPALSTQYRGMYQRGAVDGDMNVFVFSPPPQSTLLGEQPVRTTTPVVITPQMAAQLTDAAGAPLSAARQAAILASNQQQLATSAARAAAPPANALPPGAVAYGAFGPLAP